MRENLPVRYSSELYDRYTERFVEVYDQGIIRRVVEENRFMRGPRSRKLVDIGTGTAQLLVRIANHPKLEHFQIIGTDYFDDMVAQARETVRRHGLENRITIDRCDVHNLPYPDEFTEFVTSRSTIHHWADPVKAFQEIYRILKPQGVAIVHEPRRDPNPEALAEFNRQREQAGVPPTTLDEKYTPEEVAGFLDQAGLRRQSIVSAPTRGPRSLGFEVRISKCHPAKVRILSWIAKVKVLQHSR